MKQRPEAEEKTALFRFLGDLEDFLRPSDRGKDLTVSALRRSIKDAAESLGVPHPEIGGVTVNGRPVSWNDPLCAGDRAEASPSRETGALRFVLDVHLGKLARILRFLGFDTLYRNDFQDETLARISAGEDRILLTRDVGLLKRSAVSRGRWVRSRDPRLQAVEVVRRYRLGASAALFTRCGVCNGLLEPVRKEGVLHLLPAKTAAFYDSFTMCPVCGRIYWPGTHFTELKALADSVMHRP